MEGFGSSGRGRIVESLSLEPEVDQVVNDGEDGDEQERQQGVVDDCGGLQCKV